MKKSVVTANYVTRVFGYEPPKPFDWGRCEEATKDQFTSWGWEMEWATICREVADLGVEAIEVWVAHLPYDRVDERHVKQFARIISDHGLKVSAYAGWFGGPNHTKEDYERACVAANILTAPYLQGGIAWDRLDVSLPVLRAHGVKVTIENHPGMETPEKMLAQIAAAPDVLGAGPDTGWFAVVNIDAADAVRTLGSHVWHVHWKDMEATGAHHSCAMGYGVVGLERVLDVLNGLGYSGYLSLEHEPEEGDPVPAVRKGLEWLREHGQ